jgi:hypothetical protein
MRTVQWRNARIQLDQQLLGWSGPQAAAEFLSLGKKEVPDSERLASTRTAIIE